MAVLVRLKKVLPVLLLFIISPIFCQDNEEKPDTASIPIVFSGNEFFPDSVLLEAAEREIKSFKSEAGTPADLADAAYSIQSFYKNKGFPEANVSLALMENKGSKEEEITDVENWFRINRAVLTITEGSRYFLGEITFPGAKKFGAEKLRSYIPTEGAGLLGSGRALYQKDNITAGISRIQKAYILAGYLKVSVGPAKTVKDEAEKVYNVTIPIEEGKQYTIHEVTLPKNLSEDETLITQLENALPPPDSPFTYRAVAESAAKMERTLGIKGYYPEIDYSVMVNEKNAAVVIHFKFDLSYQLKFDGIVIKPSDETTLKTKEWFIKGIFPLKEGDILDIRDIEAGRDKLIESGLFTIASVKIVPEENSEDAELLVTLAETKHKFIELAAGFGTWDYLYGSVNYVDKNVFGIGRRLSLRGAGSFKSYLFTAQLDDNYLFGLNSVFTLKAAFGYTIYPTYAVRKTEAAVSLSYDLTDRIDLSGGYTFRLNRARDRIDSGWTEQADEYRVGSLSFTGLYDQRDDIFLPKKGLFLETTFEIAAPFLGSALSFYSIDFSGDYHISFTPSFLLTIETEYETKIPFAETTSLPRSERLYSGGPFSVRSFSKAVIGPAAAPGIPAGGLSRAEGTVEFRGRIWQDLWGAVFYDIGSIAASPWSFLTPGHAVGLGLRYYFFIGPVRLDVAYNPGPLFEADRRWAFHIAIGFSY